MADINTIKDASGKTIADYSEEYFRAKERGDTAAMAAANAAANAIRSNNGVKTTWATNDIANVAAKNQGSTYTPLNQTSHAGANWDNYVTELNNTRDYANQNPSVTQAFTQDEFDNLYGSIVGNIVQGGRYTYDYADALNAQAQGLSVTSTTYNGQQAWLIGDREKSSVSGTSGADEDLLSDQQYAAVQYEKQQWEAYNELYKQATAAGNTALAQLYLDARDQAHTNAERIRAGAWLGSYSGGADGSMYLTYGALADDSELRGGYDASNNPYAEALAGSNVGNSGTNINIGTGSSGSIAGGTGVYLPSGSSDVTVPTVGSLTGKVEDYSAYLEQMYAAKKAAALAELEAAYQNSINTLDHTQAGMADTYQAARNQTAGASELAKRNFAQYAAANGLNSGTGGQAELARNVTLQNNLNSINTAEADAVANLQLARANAEVEYNNAIAQAQASGDYELAYALYQEKVRVQEMLIDLQIQEQKFALQQYQLQYQAQRDAVSDSQWAQQLALQQQQYANSLTQSQNSTLASYGEAYLALGIMPSSQMLAAMGMTQADAQKYITALGR